MAKPKNYDVLITKTREQITKTEERLAALKEEEQQLIEEKEKQQLTAICDMMKEYNVSLDELEAILRNRISTHEDSVELQDTVA